LLVFANPDTDQIAGDIETLRQTVKRLTGKIFLRDLAFELDAVTAIFAMGSLSENPEGGSNSSSRFVNPQKRTPNYDSIDRGACDFS
jgi:hypothetical protein